MHQKHIQWGIGSMILGSLISCQTNPDSGKEEISRPNILLIMTDDQGIGDFGFMGNPYIKTPTLDQLCKESIHFTNFHVCPVSAPTRASLMTGRYPERTGIYDTYNGGAIMAGDELTLAEILKKHNYRTGIFGKWHLGDNYPGRPMDQGFDESLIHPSGGMGQVGDVFNYFDYNRSYFDPVLYYNGDTISKEGYCTDIFTEAGIDFMMQENDKPFFAYLSFNAPHTPLQVPDKYYNMYKNLQINPDYFKAKQLPHPEMSEADIESARRVYGMVSNIDDNIQRIIQNLKEKNILDQTIIVFLTDNGPQQRRYTACRKGRKGSVYEGGINVPCLIRYPNVFSGGSTSELLSSSMDLLPTLLDLCKIDENINAIDGLSLLPANEKEEKALDERILFYTWVRGFPEKYKNIAALNKSYKLVGQVSVNAPIDDFELYAIHKDKYEKLNIIDIHYDIAQNLKSEIDRWHEEISSSPNMNKIHYIKIGNPVENPVLLNRNDAKGSIGIWAQDKIYGYWDIEIEKDGLYTIKSVFKNPLEKKGELILKLWPHQFSFKNTKPGEKEICIENIRLKKGKYKFEPAYHIAGDSFILPFYVEFESLD